MRLAEFLDGQSDRVLAEAVTFARTIPILEGCSDAVLEDHFGQIYHAISADIRGPQSRTESIAKSQGHGASVDAGSAASVHGSARAASGLRSSQVVAEYRAMRSSVLRLWADAHVAGPDNASDIFRFNEAVDQAIYESVLSFDTAVEQSRQVFLGVLGHDLRSPLNSITLTAALIQRTAPQALSGPVGVRVKATKRMTALLDSLLEYNRSSLGVGMLVDKKPGDFAQAIAEELEILQAARPGQALSHHVSGTTDGRFDANKVREAIANLVNNAVRYCSDGEAPVIEVAGGADCLEFTVQNAGDISPDDARVIFEPMRRGKTQASHRTNLGLGLFIARQIARAHGGDVTFSSAEGRVTFRFQIPMQ